MILLSQDEEEEIKPQTFKPMVNIGDPSLVAPATQPNPITAEEEDLKVPAEELEKFFSSPLIELASFPISKHLEIVHEHLNETFPTDPATSTQMHKFLLLIAKSANTSLALEVKEVCQQLTVKLKTLAIN